MAPVKSVARDELIARRERILDHLGLDLEEYMRRAASSELSGIEWEAREDLDSIAFLLGEGRYVD